ncbi:MAG: hypothetical protein IKT40_03615 [Bacilli bacterium]|nr:hypothetical protein [Bacilli bacterium]
MGYRYYNLNPEGNHIPDCVIRAITLALNLPYAETVKRLQNNGDYYGCNLLNKECYEKLLDIDFNLPHYISRNKTVEEVAKDFPDDVLLIRMDGHLTTSIRGEVWDIFDCSSEIVSDFWIVY